jgi:peroxin-11B
LEGLYSKRSTIYLNLIKVLGDIIPAGQASQVFPNLLGFSANDTWCGVGGLTSSLITSYQLYD